MIVSNSVFAQQQNVSTHHMVLTSFLQNQGDSREEESAGAAIESIVQRDRLQSTRTAGQCA